MSFKQFLIEDENIKKDQDDAVDILKDLDSKDEEDIIDLDVDNDDLDELEYILDKEDDVDIVEGVISKKPLDIMRDRYKQKGRLFILRKMQGLKEGDVGSISLKTIALFKLMFEYSPKLGRFGKWKVRSNKSEYIKTHKIVDEIKSIKKKRKKLKLLKRRGGISKKIQRNKKIANAKTSGKTVDIKGKIQ